MAVLSAINYEERLVQLEDGRIMPIIGMYVSSGRKTLCAKDELRKEDRTDDPELAEVIVIGFPGSRADDGSEPFLVIETRAIQTASESEIN